MSSFWGNLLPRCDWSWTSSALLKSWASRLVEEFPGFTDFVTTFSISLAWLSCGYSHNHPDFQDSRVSKIHNSPSQEKTWERDVPKQSRWDHFRCVLCTADFFCAPEFESDSTISFKHVTMLGEDADAFKEGLSFCCNSYPEPCREGNCMLISPLQ